VAQLFSLGGIAHVMQTNPTSYREVRIVQICLIVVGMATGSGAAWFVHHAGRGWFATFFAGAFCGILGAGSAFLLLLAVLRIIWIIRFASRNRKLR